MKHFKFKTTLRAFLVLTSFSAQTMLAQTVTMDGVTYKILDAEAKTAACYAANANITSAIIRNEVEIEDVVYKVTEITANNKDTYEAGKGFTGCKKLKSVEFQQPTNLKRISNYAFRFCEALEAIDIPNGVEEIGYMAITHCLVLKTLNLPNTIKRLEGHFACSCRLLETITIPASIEYIDGAFLHACESLRSVYLLGDPAVLKAANGNSGTFKENGTWGKHVNNCTFYVNDEDTYHAYLDAETDGEHVWARVDADNEYNTTGTGSSGAFPSSKGGYNNRFAWLSENTRVFTPARWATVCFPFGLDNYKAVFGTNSIAVELESAVVEQIWNSESDPQELVRFYHMNFKTVNRLEPDKPYLIKPEYAKAYDMLTGAGEDGMTTEHWTREVITTITSDEGKITPMRDDYKLPEVPQLATKIEMIGKYLSDYKLNKSEFYLKNVGDDESGWTPYFYKAASTGATPVGAFRCFFRISRDGIRINDAKMGDWQVWDDTDGIQVLNKQLTEELSRELKPAVYSMDGRLIQSGESLRSGIYIVNGKKVIIK